MNLLSIGSNQKTSKSDALGEYLTAILYMAPHTIVSKKSLCPFSTKGCRDSCLYTAGRGAGSLVQMARERRTKLWLEDKGGFYDGIYEDLEFLQRKCKRDGVQGSVRLNGTSDIGWERTNSGLHMFQAFPEIQFYDYTKDVNRVLGRLPKNYYLTYSYNEKTTVMDVLKLHAAGHNIAVVFDTKKTEVLPEKFMGIPVIDGRTHDLRFKDKKGVIVGLSALGRATKDTTGFVVRL